MTHLIEEMLKSLGPALKSKARARKMLERYWKGKIAIIWTDQDVYRAANERELALTENEAAEVLANLYQNHNSQRGIKWEDIYGLIDQRCIGRKLTKQELSLFLNKNMITINSVL